MARLLVLVFVCLLRSRQVAQVELGGAQHAVSVRLSAFSNDLEDRMRARAPLVHLRLLGHSIPLPYPEQVEAVPLVLHCVVRQVHDLDASLLVLSELERIFRARVLEQVVDLFVVNLDEGALDCDFKATFSDLPEDVEEHSQHEASLL